MPAAEQVSLFSRAHLLIGVHGAGLTNVLFMNPHSAVLELLPTRQQFNNMLSPCDVGAWFHTTKCSSSRCGFSQFWALAAAVGVEHHVLPIADAGWNDVISLPRGTVAEAAASIVLHKGGHRWKLS